MPAFSLTEDHEEANMIWFLYRIVRLLPVPLRHYIQPRLRRSHLFYEARREIRAWQSERAREPDHASAWPGLSAALKSGRGQRVLEATP